MDFAEQSSRYKMVIQAIQKYVLDKDTQEEIRLPSEIQLANRLGISRAHVREIYRALCVFGVCESRQGEGTFIRNSINDQIFDAFSLVLIGNSANIMEIMEVRKILETGIAENAASNRSQEDVREMKVCLKKMAACRDYREMSKLDTELHELIGRSCGNELLVTLSMIISGAVHKTILEHWKYLLSDDIQTNVKNHEQHVELVEAISEHKPYIARAIAQEHVDSVIRSLTKYWYRNK